jgi:uncharacterized protein (DUF934 family)
MPLLINQKLVENDPWLTIDPETLGEVAELPAGDIIVPFSYYQEHAESLKSRSAGVAVKVTGDDDLASLYAIADRFPLIAIEFPVFRDGRGFSIARQLVRVGYTGEIRATGDVARDRLAYMQSSGFNAFLIPEQRFSSADLTAFSEISVNYQGTTEDPRPIFRR